MILWGLPMNFGAQFDGIGYWARTALGVKIPRFPDFLNIVSAGGVPRTLFDDRDNMP